MIFKSNTPLKVCLLLRPGVVPGANVRVGEYVCLPPARADGLARVGAVALISDVVKTADVKAAGGWRKLLQQNPKLRAMSKNEETRLWEQVERVAPPASTAEQDDFEAPSK